MTAELMKRLNRKPTFAESFLALHMKKSGHSVDEIVRAINGQAICS